MKRFYALLAIGGQKPVSSAHRILLPLALACLLAWWGAVGLAVEGRAQDLAQDKVEGSATLTLSDSAGENPSGTPAIFVPVLLTASGLNSSYYTSELTLTNRGSQTATLRYTYTAHIGGGSGTASDSLAAGRQKIVPNAIGYLKSRGVPIPAAGNRVGTLRVEVSGPSDVSVSVRTTTPVPEGRAGLAYPGIATADGFTAEAVYLCGLRQNRQDRSNVAIQNMGTAAEGNVTLRATAYSGDSGGGSRVLPEVTLAPGGFHQFNGILGTAGFAQGYVKVERVGGGASFYAYGVINDNSNSDGSFVFPVAASSLAGVAGQTLPVLVGTGGFSSELMVTNFSEAARTVRFTFVAEAIGTADRTARFSQTLAPGEQQIVPDIVGELRRSGVAGVGPSGAYVGALFASAAGGDLSGVVIGARTGSAGSGGQYGVYYNAVPYGAAFTGSAWVVALQQNRENRSNLALVNTGEVDGSASLFELEIYDGATGQLVNLVTGIRIRARGWRQISGILGSYAQGVTQGYVWIKKTSGNNPFLAYGVINDGGAPGQRSGDGAYLPASGATVRPDDADFKPLSGLTITAAGAIRIGGITNLGCISSPVQINGVRYVVHWTEWRRRTAGSAWTQVAGTRKNGQMCGYNLSNAPAGEYRFVGEMTVNGVRGRYRSENTVTFGGSSNQSPATVVTIPDQTLVVRGGPTTMRMSAAFTDPDGDALSYSATTADDNVATVGASEAVVRINPVSEGTTTVSVTATDAGGLSASNSFGVTVERLPSRRHNIILRVVHVTTDWMPYAGWGGWPAATERKESASLKYFEAAIWDETASVHLYEFNNDFDVWHNAGTDSSRIAYREQYVVRKHTGMPSDWIARQEFVKSAFTDFARYISERFPDSDHHLLYSGHGGPGGRLFGGLLSKEGASPHFSPEVGSIGSQNLVKYSYHRS